MPSRCTLNGPYRIAAKRGKHSRFDLECNIVIQQQLGIRHGQSAVLEFIPNKFPGPLGEASEGSVMAKSGRGFRMMMFLGNNRSA